MILVQNHRLPSSGNKWLIYVGLALVAGACTPKLQQPAPPPKPVKQPVVKAPEVKPPVKVEPRFSNISLILPFNLDYIKAGYSSNALKEANIAVEYYQGFKLALDSLTASGYNYKLQVYDSKDQPSQGHALANNLKIRESDLIVGPVFPVTLKAFTDMLTSQRKPIVSPLASAAPSTFKNQNLITAIPPLEYHVWAGADYIATEIKAKKVFVLKSGYSEESEYLTTFKKAIDSLGKKRIKINQLTVVHGNLKTVIPQLSLTEQNVFVIPATNQQFLLVTMHTLDSLAKNFPITVFGHPSWQGFSFLKADVLQRLNTHITSSQNINYKAPETIAFLRAYRKAYSTEPTEFSIKGFDEALYFGKLLGEDKDRFKNLDKQRFEGLHNSFQFVKKPGLGWINTHVNVLKYSNFALQKVK